MEASHERSFLQLLQPRILRLGFLQDGDVGITLLIAMGRVASNVFRAPESSFSAVQTSMTGRAQRNQVVPGIVP